MRLFSKTQILVVAAFLVAAAVFVSVSDTVSALGDTVISGIVVGIDTDASDQKRVHDQDLAS